MLPDLIFRRKSIGFDLYGVITMNFYESRALPALTVVIPVRNEQDSILPLSDEIDKVLRDRFNYELIFVNDGSNDRTQSMIETVRSGNRRIRYITIMPGCGQTEALHAGFQLARGEFIATMDGDGQNDPADLIRLFDALSDHDMACGYRIKRHDNLNRRLVSHVANIMRNRITHIQIRDIGCSIRVFKRYCLDNITLYHGMHRFFPILFSIAGYSFIQIPVSHRPRVRGLTKYGIWNRLKYVITDLFVVRWMQKRSLTYQIIGISDAHSGSMDSKADQTSQTMETVGIHRKIK